MPKIGEIISGGTLSEALRLYHKGFWVVPMSGKRPLVKNWQNQRVELETTGDGWDWESRDKWGLKKWFGFDELVLNIAIVLNQSDLIDVECDTDEAEAAFLALFGGVGPRTPTWKSKRGLHRLFHRPNGLPDRAVMKRQGIEFRIGNGPGALSIVPPSVHPDGTRYEYLPRLSIHAVEPAELPAHIVELLLTPPRRTSGAVATARGKVVEGSRDNTLFGTACLLVRQGMEEETVLNMIAAMNRVCEPPYPEREVRRIVSSALRYDPHKAGGINGINQIPSSGGIPLIQLIPPELKEPAYHGIMGEFIRAVDPYTEATDAGILAHLLPAIGTLIGPGPYVFAGSEQPARVNTVLVGPTSTGRKGTALTPIDLLLKRVDPEFWETQRMTGLSTGEGLIATVADRKNQDGKEETVSVDRRLYVVEEEFSKVMAQGKREGNTLSHVIRDAFGRGDLGVMTKTNPVRVSGAHISITGHITPEELEAKLDTVDQANGFGNRFLWFYIKSDKVKPQTDPIPEAVFDKFTTRLQNVRAVEPRCLRMADTAAAVWADELYPRLRADRPGLAGAMTARGSTFVLRLALIYCLLDDQPCIRVEHLRAAEAVWTYCEESAYQLFQTKTGTPIGDRILSLLGTNGPMQKQQFTDHISQSVAVIDAALEKLLAEGKVSKGKQKKDGPGRPAEVWELANQN